MTDAAQPNSRNTQAQPDTRDRNRRKRPLTSTQVTFAAILAIGLMLALNFSARIDADRDLQEIRRKVEQEIDLLRREQSSLIAELDYAASDAFVEAWARSEGKMVREGEVLVIPVPLTVATPVTDAETVAVSDFTDFADEPLDDVDNWKLWWSLLFDVPPPG